MYYNLLTSVIKRTCFTFMKIVTLPKQNRRFDFFSILLKNRDFDLDCKNRHSTIINIFIDDYVIKL